VPVSIPPCKSQYLLVCSLLLALGLSFSAQRLCAEELTNGAFDGDITTSWTYFDWDDAEGVFSGSDPDSGGNPDGNAELKWDGFTAVETTNGGYWQQSFTIAGEVGSARIKFDWIKIERVANGGGASNNFYEMYVFVDSSAGAPTAGTEFWKDTLQGTTSWSATPMQDLDISSVVNGPGTYYVKIAVVVKAKNARVRSAFDNLSVVVSPPSGVRVWRGDTAAWDSTNYSTIQAAVDSISTSIAAWSVDDDGNAVVFEVVDSATYNEAVLLDTTKIPGSDSTHKVSLRARRGVSPEIYPTAVGNAITISGVQFTTIQGFRFRGEGNTSNTKTGVKIKDGANGCRVENCTFDNFAWHSTSFLDGGVAILGVSNVQLENCTFYRCYVGIQLNLANAKGASIRNCIFYIESGVASVTPAYGIRQDHVDVLTGFSSNDNCFFRSSANGNTITGWWSGSKRTTLSGWTGATGTDAQSIDSDPFFATESTTPGSSDFHLKSPAGRYSAGAWVTTDTVTSPCIDTGATTGSEADFSNEPAPNGARVNMGAFGNTDRASKSSALTGVRVWRGDTASWDATSYTTIQAAIDSISTSIAGWSVDSDGNAVVIEVRDSATYNEAVLFNTTKIPGSDATHKVTLRAAAGQFPEIYPTAAGDAVTVTGVAYTTIQGFKLRGEGTSSNTKSGIKLQSGASNCTVKNCSFDNFAFGDASLVDGGVAIIGVASTTLINCTFYRCLVGIELNTAGCSSTKIRNCIFYIEGAVNGAKKSYGISQDHADGMSGFSSNYNCFFRKTVDSNTVTGWWSGATKVTLADWKGATGGDAQSIASDPLLASESSTPGSSDLHLKSAAGRYSAGVWVTTDSVTSPSIDAGATTGDEANFSSEPSCNGGLVNLGAFGNTSQASKSGAFVIENGEASQVEIDRSVAPNRIYAGNTKVWMLGVKVNTCNTPVINTLSVRLAGSVVDADISAVHFYLSSNSSFELSTDTWLGVDTSIVSLTATLSGLSQSLSGSTYWIFYAVDFASGSAGKTVRLELPTAVEGNFSISQTPTSQEPGIQADNPDGAASFTIQATPGTPELQLQEKDTRKPAAILAGGTGYQFGAVRLQANGAFDLASIRVDLPDGATGNGDDISLIRIFKSADATFDGSDSLLGSLDPPSGAPPAAGWVVSTPYVATPGETFWLIIVLDLASTATAGNTIGSLIDVAGDFVLNSGALVDASVLPLDTGTRTLPTRLQVDQDSITDGADNVKADGTAGTDGVPDYSTIQAAIDSVGATSTPVLIEILDSSTYAEALTIPSSGIYSTSNTLTIKGAAGKWPLIDSTGSTDGISIGDPGVIIEHLIVTGNTNHGIDILASGDSATLRNLLIYQNGINQIHVAGGAGLLTIENCTIYESVDGLDLIVFDSGTGTGHTIKNCIVMFGLSSNAEAVHFTSADTTITADYNCWFRISGGALQFTTDGTDAAWYRAITGEDPPRQQPQRRR